MVFTFYIIAPSTMSTMAIPTTKSDLVGVLALVMLITALLVIIGVLVFVPIAIVVKIILSKQMDREVTNEQNNNDYVVQLSNPGYIKSSKASRDTHTSSEDSEIPTNAVHTTTFIQDQVTVPTLDNVVEEYDYISPLKW